MNPFKRKEVKPNNLQSKETEFNQVIYEVGGLTYQKHLVKQNLSTLNSEIHTRLQRADNLAKEAQTLRSKIKAEINETVKQEQDNATPPNAQPAE